MKISLLATHFAMLLLLTGVQTGNAQITYLDNFFVSQGVAQTDAGNEYDYYIDEADVAGPTGVYQFIEYGSAPGYGSRATIGVEHDSKLTSGDISLAGKTYSYVADDYGYAWCFAESYASSTVRFQLSSRRRVELTGNLTLVGSSPPDWYYNSVELRTASGQLIYQKTGVGPVNFSNRLVAGTYQITVVSTVAREIDFSGGDVYENSNAGFNVLLRAR
ncbi:MAG TPA: hypothetical protein PKD64_06305 [Pirellulaceae bacterium]|nr:hypothetical protein [Pirellulaceae bacterium]HMO91793.1 hypothetical protein [Pirellulaceae bacterium]HMP69592.1 hypothetical protein [Pirellulaceae bacterium]